MIVSRIHALYVIFATTLVLVNGQTTHTITVGVAGSFFDPPTLSAGLNDTVTFIFGGDVHTVTQSTFENPCLPLPGGFNSGLAGRGISNGSAPTWDLRITDILRPIWFFCEATRPSSHCAAGMVGSINPPNQTMYNRFVSAAKQVSGTPAPTFSVALTGQGAFATRAPAVPTTSVPFTPSQAPSATPVSTETSLSTAVPTTNASTSVSTRNLGAIVGGAVGGILALLLVAAGLYWLYQVRRYSNHNRGPESPEPFDTREHSRNTLYFRSAKSPIRSPSEVSTKHVDTAYSYVNAPSSPPAQRAVSTDSTMVLAPVRRGETSPSSNVFSAGRVVQYKTSYTNLSSSIERKPSASDIPSPPLSSTSASYDQHTSTQVNLNTLAKEVAAALLKSPSLGNLHQKQPSQQPQPQHADTTSGASSSSGFRAGGHRPMHIANAGEADRDHLPEVGLPPPTYRTAMGSSPLHQVSFDKER
ncbi:unnamed protein product [Cyclocybe aegerita]|uniref:Extracellular serine-rich protein n=1 Tax=Cyclocybe aegerita TaxID=1973307 RepID=A0A8S0WRX6_CYCAE|nr:unnamed protein product [Cyclocybe aegerita]